MTVLVDPDRSPEDMQVAQIVAGCTEVALTSSGNRLSASDRARRAGAADLTIVVRHRRQNPLVCIDPCRQGSSRFGRLVASLIGTAAIGWTRHEVFGRLPRTAHARPVVIVQPQSGTPAWQSAAAILCALERYSAA